MHFNVAGENSNFFSKQFLRLLQAEDTTHDETKEQKIPQKKCFAFTAHDGLRAAFYSIFALVFAPLQIMETFMNQLISYKTLFFPESLTCLVYLCIKWTQIKIPTRGRNQEINETDEECFAINFVEAFFFGLMLLFFATQFSCFFFVFERSCSIRNSILALQKCLSFNLKRGAARGRQTSV